MNKIISIILCVTMLFTLAIPAFAKNSSPDILTASASQAAELSGDYPIIFVTGIGQTWSYVKNEDGTPKTVNSDGTPKCFNLFYADTDGLLNSPEAMRAILKLVFQLLFSFVFDYNLVGKEDASVIVETLFKYNTVNEKGNLDPAVAVPYYDAPISELSSTDTANIFRSIPCQNIIKGMEDRVFCYTYSSFSFLYNDAAGLDTYINDVVLKHCNAEKVILIPMSMGAAVVNAYLDTYGTKAQVAKVVSIVGCWDGSDVLADLIEQKYDENANELVYNGLVAELVGAPWGYLINMLLRCMPREQLRGIINTVLDVFVDVMITPATSLLALIPSDRYPAIRDTVLSGNELAYIRVQTDRYYNAQKNLKERMYDLNENYGVEFYFISGYNLTFGGAEGGNYGFFGFLESAATTNSDEIINIESTSPGITAVTAGTSFAENYTTSSSVCTDASHNHLSPDKSVDASTCYFPERCWFFEGQKHELENNNTALKLAFNIALGEIDSVADCMDTFPQFNESRDVKQLTRNYIPALNEYISQYSSDSERAEYVAKAQAALDKANVLLESTINNREADDAVIAEVYDVLCEIGVYEQSTESSSWFETTFNDLLKGANDTVYDVFGAQGYADMILNLFK